MVVRSTNIQPSVSGCTVLACTLSGTWHGLAGNPIIRVEACVQVIGDSLLLLRLSKELRVVEVSVSISN